MKTIQAMSGETVLDVAITKFNIACPKLKQSFTLPQININGNPYMSHHLNSLGLFGEYDWGYYRGY